MGIWINHTRIILPNYAKDMVINNMSHYPLEAKISDAILTFNTKKPSKEKAERLANLLLAWVNEPEPAVTKVQLYDNAPLHEGEDLDIHIWFKITGEDVGRSINLSVNPNNIPLVPEGEPCQRVKIDKFLKEKINE